MQRARFALQVALALLCGVMAGCSHSDQPPTTADMVDYVQHGWNVVATADDIREVLSLDDPQTQMPFKSEVGGIIAVIAMVRDIDQARYADAAWRGGKWLLPFALKQAGLKWLSAYVSLAEATYGLLEWLAQKANGAAFNAQIRYYLWWREDGVSEEEMDRDDPGWLLNPEERMVGISVLHLASPPRMRFGSGVSTGRLGRQSSIVLRKKLG